MNNSIINIYILNLKYYLLLYIIELFILIYNESLYKYYYLSIFVILTSPFIEYLAHKYVLHLPMPKNINKHPIFVKFLKQIHYNHHDDPKNIEFLFAEHYLIIPSMILLLFITWLITKNINLSLNLQFYYLVYYLYYEWFHLSSHTCNVPITKYGIKMKKHHLLHHYKDKNQYYGITSNILDNLIKFFKKDK